MGTAQEEPASLRRQVLSGGLWSATSRLVTIGIQMMSTVLLARLLSPEDFGLFAMTLIFVGFSSIIAHLGLANALIQRRDLTETHLSTAFWANEIVSIGLTVVLFLAAPLIAAFFREPQLVGLIRLVSLSFSLQLATVPIALLERSFRFRAIAMVETTSLGLGLVAAVISALAGLGATSLAIQTLVATCSWSILSLLATRWLPRARPTMTALREIWSVGGWLTAGNLIGYWTENVDTIALGRTVSSAEVGYYNRAYNLLLLPLQSMGNVLTRVVVPALASMQDNNERTRFAWQRSTRTLALILFPTCVGIAASSPSMVLTLWGTKWEAVVPLLRLLSLAGVPWAVVVACEWLLFGRGRARKYFYLTLCNTGFTAMLVVAGLPWGPKGVATAVLIRSWVILPFYIRFCMGELGITIRGVAGMLWAPLVASTVMGLSVAALGGAMTLKPIAEFSIQVVVGVVIYGAAIWLMDPALVRSLTEAVRRRTSQPVSQTELEELADPGSPNGRGWGLSSQSEWDQQGSD